MHFDEMVSVMCKSMVIGLCSQLNMLKWKLAYIVSIVMGYTSHDSPAAWLSRLATKTTYNCLAMLLHIAWDGSRGR